MKKLTMTVSMVLGTVLASQAMATGTGSVGANASSVAGATTQSSAVSAGNGYAYQTSGAGAFNTSYAGAGASNTNSVNANFNKWNYNISATTLTKGATEAGSAGSTYSYVKGYQFGNASGQSSSLAGQFGKGEATMTGGNLHGVMDIGSDAKVGSLSGSANVGWGFAKNGTSTSAHNETNGQVGGSTSIGGKSLFYIPYTVSSLGNSSVAEVNTHGSTETGSYDVKFGAVGSTGGFAKQNGGGFAIAP